MQDPKARGLPWSRQAACLAVLAFRAYQDRDVFYDRFNLPAFDGHVYAAMSEEPRVFTVAPWGYRLLTPSSCTSPWNARARLRTADAGRAAAGGDRDPRAPAELRTRTS